MVVVVVWISWYLWWVKLTIFVDVGGGMGGSGPDVAGREGCGSGSYGGGLRHRCWYSC